MGPLFPAVFHKLLQREAVGRQRTLQHVPRLVHRKPVGFKGCRPFQFSLARTQITHLQGRQTVAKGRVGQQDVTEPVGDLVQRFKALDDRVSAVGAGQRALRADTLAHNRAVDDPDKVLVNRAFYLSRGSDRRRREEAVELVLVAQHVQQAPHFGKARWGGRVKEREHFWRFGQSCQM